MQTKQSQNQQKNRTLFKHIQTPRQATSYWPMAAHVYLMLTGSTSFRFGRISSWFESRWSPGIFQASSFQLLKLENLLRWSLFTFIYNHCTLWISDIFHIISLHGKIWTQQIDLAPNVCLHSSVGRASHRYRGSHGFEALIFFRLLPCNCLSWKIYCNDHSSLSSTTAV